MAIYYIIYAAISIAALVVVNKDIETKRKGLCMVAFVLLFLMLALRHESMGVDLRYRSDTGYLGSFDVIKNYSWKGIFTKERLNYEHGYIVFNKLISVFSRDRRILLVVCAFISIFPPMLLIRKKSNEPYLSIIILIALPVFLMFYSGLRQSIAIGITIFASFFIEKKQPIPFILLVALAWTFHASAILFFVAYPMYYWKQNGKWKLALILSIPLLYLVRRPVFLLLSKILEDDVKVIDTGAFTLFIVFYMVYIMMLIMNNRKNIQNTGYVNLFYIACFCQVFGGLHNLAMRAGYYFMPYLVIALPNLTLEMDDNNSTGHTKTLFYIGVLMAFLLYGLYAIRHSTWARAYPYYFFWVNGV